MQLGSVQFADLAESAGFVGVEEWRPWSVLVTRNVTRIKVEDASRDGLFHASVVGM
jgi:hypothetical protein